MDWLTAARDDLYAALVHVFDEPVDIPGGATVQYSPDRVHRVSPATVVAPCLWIDSSSGVDTDDAAAYTTTFPVVIVHDGADRAQVAGIEQIVARVVEAALGVGRPRGWEPRALDVGGPTLRSSRVDVDIEVLVTSICPIPVSTLVEVSS